MMSNNCETKTYNVIFRSSLGSVPATDSTVALVGNLDIIGAWKPRNGMAPYSISDQGFEWRMQLTKEQIQRMEYKYVSNSHAGDVGQQDKSVWWPLYDSNLKIGVCDYDSDEIVIDDWCVSVHFKLYLALDPNESLFICGSHPAFGEWKQERAVKLNCESSDRWTVTLSLPRRIASDSKEIEFKYAVGSGGSAVGARYETRNNRVLDLRSHFDRFGPDLNEISLFHAWDGTIARLVMFHPLPDGHQLGAIGSLPALGDWKRPVAMGLGPERRTLTGQRARCWELTFTVDGSGVRDVVYRYTQLNQTNNSAVWEREPNRVLSVPATYDVPTGLFEQFDGNFVTGMDIDRVSNDILLGPYPQTAEDIDEIIAAGARAVLNVQTEVDFRKRQIDWHLLSKCYKEKGIPVALHPIEDFDGSSLERNLLSAAAHVRGFANDGRCVYIHCTAGMGRAPAVAIAHMVQAEGISSAEALERIKRVRPKVGPNMSVIGRVLQR